MARTIRTKVYKKELEQEYYELCSDAEVVDTIICNKYEFTQDGGRFL